jgi:uncharacterized membrane protein YfcA
MELYLPVAEMSVNWAMILGMGAAVGFLSGMFGVGGGFLMTPLLVFYGIPPGIAVATQASHITASSLSGALAQWRRQAVDVKMGAILMAGGLTGSAIGVYLFQLFRELGQIELVVNGGYVVLLGSIGGLMLNESMRVMRAARSGTALPPVKAHQHSWIHGLPLKMRFRRSRLYISVIPPIILGIIVGVLTAVMGVGGGFIMIPAMIYLLRMPTNVVIGTSQFQILFVTAAATILHAASDQTVDIVLAFLLVSGGVIGVQMGVRVGSQMRGEQLRALLGLLVLAVALRLFIGLVQTPEDIYSIVAETP